jgi:hypothetical protein
MLDSTRGSPTNAAVWPLHPILRTRCLPLHLRFALVLTAAVAMVVPASPARSDAGTWHTQTWNMAMGNDPTDVKWQEKKDIARFIVTSGTPWVASFQEMCRDQFDALKPELDSLGYHVVGFWPWSVNTHPQCHGTKIGSAVFVLVSRVIVSCTGQTFGPEQGDDGWRGHRPRRPTRSCGSCSLC